MIRRIKYRLQFLKMIIPYAHGVKRFFVINFIFSLIALGLSFLTPVFYRMFIEQVVLQGQLNRFLWVLGGYLSICAINIAMGYVKFHGNNRLINDTVLKIKYKIWGGLFTQEFAEYEKQSIGDTKMKIEDDPNSAAPFASAQTIDYVIAYLTLFGSAFFLFYLDWRLALFSITVIPLAFYFDNWTSKREKVYNEQMRVNDQNMSSWLHASVQGWREVKALNLQRYEKMRFVRFINKHGKLYAKWVHYWTIRVLLLPRIRDDLFMQFGLYFFGGLLIIFGNLKISDLLVFSMYYGMLSGAVRTVSSKDADLQAVMPYINRLMSQLGKAEIEQRNGKIPDDTNIITLSDVSFSYDGSDKVVINHFSLDINKGERIAITGKSGCGKTTLLKLITGMVEPTEGRVFFCNIDLKDIDIGTMHKRIGYVMQENLLFNTTIRENLIYGKSNATEDDMLEACKKAYIYDFIESLPDKLDTIIGERGIKLSGGQRQRIVLARLFLRDVDIFIFDEATNALDQYSENIVHDAIRSIGKDKTIIIVAHRESSIQLCEKKILMHEV